MSYSVLAIYEDRKSTPWVGMESPPRRPTRRLQQNGPLNTLHDPLPNWLVAVANPCCLLKVFRGYYKTPHHGDTLIANWEREVRQSGLVILPDGDAYLPGIGIRVSDVVQHLAFGNGIGEQTLRQTYPTLTDTHQRVCSLFCYLRVIDKI